MSFSPTRLPYALLLVLAGGCRVFDPELYMHRDGAPEGGDAADVTPGPDTGADGGSPTLALGETCNVDLPTATAGIEYAIDTTSLANDFEDLSGCIGSATPGRDGFFQVMMTQGEKWHFHLKVTTDTTATPVLYVLSSCNELSCQSGDGIDECPTGKDEHITYVARRTGLHYIGVDSTTANAGAPYKILVVRVVCGDGTQQHSEGCDNGAANGDGTGCDSQCRYELTPALANHVTEQEPDDDFSDANVVRIVDTDGGTGGLGSLTVNGSFLTRCEYDTYAVRVPAGGGQLAVTMLDGTGNTCTTAVSSAVSPISMSLMGSDRSMLGAGATTVDNPCPALPATQLPEGEYLIRLTTASHVNPADGSTTALQYRLRFDVTP